MWHHRIAEPEFGDWLANELVSMLEAMLAETELRAFRGEKIVEVKPAWANTGEAFERLLTASSQPDFLFAAGDDRTDEDLFERRQSEAWTVHVGPGSTRAAFVVPDLELLRTRLQAISQSTRASQEPTGHPQKKITGDGRGSSPKTLKRLAILVFSRRSFPPSSTESA